MKSNYTPNFYKDIPIPYFVCSVELNLDSSLKDVIFSYVNVEFCKVASKKEKDLIGKSFLKYFQNPIKPGVMNFIELHI